MPLTASSQRADPLSFYFTTDPVELRLTVVQTEILVEAAQHPRQLLLLILPLPMPMLPEPLLGFSQELSAAFNARNPHQGKLASSISAAHKLKTQEVKRIRLIAGLRQVPSDKASESHYPRLFLRQFQPEFSESIRQVLLELFRIDSENSG